MISEQDIMRPVDEALDACFTLSTSARKSLYSALFQLLKDRSISSPDLDAKLSRFGLAVEKMVSKLEIRWNGKKFVVKTSPQDRDTLILLQRGSLWFNGMDNIEEVIIATVFKL